MSDLAIESVTRIMILYNLILPLLGAILLPVDMSYAGNEFLLTCLPFQEDGCGRAASIE